MIAGTGGTGRRSWEWVCPFSRVIFFANGEISGVLLLRGLVKALAMKKKHTAISEKFDATLPANLRREWQEMISQWERDKSKPNPYTHTEKGSYLVSCPPYSVALTFA